jgi:hypothetical protein
MTSTDTAGSPSRRRTGGKPSKLEDVIMQTILLFVMAAPMIVMMTMSKRLTPDFLYALMSTDDYGSFMSLAIVGNLVVLGGLSILLWTRGHTLSMGLVAYASWTLMIYTMGAGSEASDYEGASNPYVRAQTIEDDRYSDLAELRRYPVVAAEIRRAAADGRITKGEAYDIEHGQGLNDARAREYEARQARDRAAVLAS